jgi:hypothetical protein
MSVTIFGPFSKHCGRRKDMVVLGKMILQHTLPLIPLHVSNEMF